MKINLTNIKENHRAAEVHYEQYLTSVAFFQEHNIANFYDKFPTISRPLFFKFCLDAINAHLMTIQAEAFNSFEQSYDFGYISLCLKNDQLNTQEIQETFINDLVDAINGAEVNGPHAQYMVAIEFLRPFIDPDSEFY